MQSVFRLGEINVVLPMVTAVTDVKKYEKNHGFVVYIMGSKDPLMIVGATKQQAEDLKDDLIEAISLYYFARDMGADIIDEFYDDYDEFDDEDDLDDEPVPFNDAAKKQKDSSKKIVNITDKKHKKNKKNEGTDH